MLFINAALANNSGTTEMPVRQVTDKAVAMAGDAAYGEAARITALQICAKLSDTRVLLPAREIAFGKYGAPLRVSAIAALGAMGDGSDLAQPKPLAQSTDIRLRTAAAAAVKKLSDRRVEKAEEKPQIGIRAASP
jgi:HEAT repeat protein